MFQTKSQVKINGVVIYSLLAKIFAGVVSIKIIFDIIKIIFLGFCADISKK